MPTIICEPEELLLQKVLNNCKVNLRKKQKLYINDETYGSLFDGGFQTVYPTRLITNGRLFQKN